MKKAADEGQGYASALAQAKAAGRIEDEIKALEEALKFKQDAKVEAWLADARRRKEQGEIGRASGRERSEMEEAMGEGKGLVGQAIYASRRREMQNLREWS